MRRLSLITSFALLGTLPLHDALANPLTTRLNSVVRAFVRATPKGVPGNVTQLPKMRVHLPQAKQTNQQLEEAPGYSLIRGTRKEQSRGSKSASASWTAYLAGLPFYVLSGFDGDTPESPRYHSSYCSIDFMGQFARAELLRESFEEWSQIGSRDHYLITQSFRFQKYEAPIMTGAEMTSQGATRYLLIQCDTNGKLSAAGVIDEHSSESELALLIARPGNPGGAGKALLNEWRSISHARGSNRLTLKALPDAAKFYEKYGFKSSAYRTDSGPFQDVQISFP